MEKETRKGISVKLNEKEVNDEIKSEDKRTIKREESDRSDKER